MCEYHLQKLYTFYILAGKIPPLKIALQSLNSRIYLNYNLMRNPLSLVSATAVDGNKISLQFSQEIPELRSGITSNSILGLLNEGDERFNNTNKAQMAFMVAERAQVTKYFGVDVSKLTYDTKKKIGKSIDLNIEDPTINGMALNIQINEFQADAKFMAKLKGSSLDLAKANPKKFFKINPSDNTFVTCGGFKIKRQSMVVTGAPKHTLCPSDTAQSSVSVASDIVLAEGLH